MQKIILIILVTVLSYANILNNQFVIDDKTFIVNWQTKNNFDLAAFFKGDVPMGHEGVYRPIRSMIYSLYWPIFNAYPFGYHLHSILIHLFSTVLIYLILIRLFPKLAFWTALLFGVHPIHTETISYISSSMETTGIVFFLLSFYFYIKGKTKNYYILSVILAGLAFFTSEITLTLPLVIIFYDLLFNNKSKFSINKYVPYFLAAAGYLVTRFFILHIVSRGPYLADSIYLTFLTMTKVIIKYIVLTIVPINQAVNQLISKGIEASVYRDYRTEAIKAQTIGDWQILLSLALIIILLLMIVKFWRKYPLISFGLGWFFITLLPVLEIVPQGAMLNERFLYLPSLGILLIIVYTISNLAKKPVMITFLLLLTVFYSVLTISRNFDWHDNISLWSKDVQVYPNDNAYAYFQLGNAYLEKNEVEAAIKNYQTSFNINPYFVVALGSIARTYNNAGRRQQAIDFYNKALNVNPYFWEGYYNLADIYYHQAQFNLAKEQYQKLLAIAPQFELVRQKLIALPAVVEASQSAGVRKDNVWLKYHSLNNLSLIYPSSWYLKDGYQAIKIQSPDKQFSIDISFDQKPAQVSASPTTSPYMKEFELILGSIK